MLPRLRARCRASRAPRAFVLLEDLIARHVETIFPGGDPRGRLRLPRHAQLRPRDRRGRRRRTSSRRSSRSCRRRERGNAVRLEVARRADARSLAKLVKALKLDPGATSTARAGRSTCRPLLVAARRARARATCATRRSSPAAARRRRHLRGRSRAGRAAPPPVRVVRPRRRAHRARRPTIPTSSRSSRRSTAPAATRRSCKALARAAETGKQVTAIVELKARFDEESNIVWARTLEQRACTWSTASSASRRTRSACSSCGARAAGLRRYVHLATGNYNPTTARLYTDFGLLTAGRDIGEDVSSLFNLLTGYSDPPRSGTS